MFNEYFGKFCDAATREAIPRSKRKGKVSSRSKERKEAREAKRNWEI